METPRLRGGGMQRVRSDASAGGVPRGATQRSGRVAIRKKAGADKVNCRAAAREGGLDHMETARLRGGEMERASSDAAPVLTL